MMHLTFRHFVDRLHLLAVIGASFACAPALAEDALPPDPELERRTFKVADGFEIDLWAADPLVAKPIAMNFDAQGRLWVATSTTYPQVKPGEAPNDKVVVLEDSDNNGRADKTTVFADGLLIPTGIVPGDGGAYVANSTEVLHLRDGGDLHAASRRVVLSGFGTEDTHHIIHTFRWGPDAKLFFNQSIYIHSHIETPRGVRRLNGSGTWRFDPQSLELQIYNRGLVNPWGFAWDRFGQTFATDGAGFGGIHFAFPGSAFESANDVKRTLGGMNPGSPKYCGLEYLDGRHLPDDWQGDLITADFRANRIVRYKMIDQDGVYIAKQMPDVVVSTDRAFRPVDIKMGPDGAIYVADWYNPIINHGEVDFRDPRRDKSHGRIWKITAKGRPLVSKPKIVDATETELLELLKAPEQWTRLQAKLALHARGREKIAPALQNWVKSLAGDDAATEHARLEALWTYQGLDAPAPELLARLLESKDHRTREAAVRVVPDWADRMPNALDLLKARVADEHPRVRLEAVCALARIPDARSITIAVLARDKPLDPLIDYALLMAANQLKPVWLPQFTAGKLNFGDNPEHLNYALQAVESSAALDILRSQVAFDTVPKGSRESTLDMLANIGKAPEASLMMDVALRRDESFDAAGRARILDRIAQMARRGGGALATHQKDLPTLFAAAEPPAVRAAGLRLAGVLKREALRGQIAQVAADADAPAPVRQAAIGALAELGGDASLETISKLAADQPPEVRTMALAGLAALNVSGAAAKGADLLASDAAGIDPSAVIAIFARRDGGAAALAAALKDKKLPVDGSKLALRYLNTSGQADPQLLAIFRQGAGLGTTPQPPTPQQVAQLTAELKERGDPKRGEAIFRRADSACYQCHAIAGAGAQVGPDLRALGASSPPDYIVESILAPNKAVKENYASMIVATKDGQVFTGIKVEENDKQLVLRDAVSDRIPINKSDIRRSRISGSLMPEGLADTLTHAELVDLLRFLTELGKPGEFAAQDPQLIRRWRVLDNVSADAAHYNPRLLEPGVVDSALVWKPAYSTAGGELPGDAWVRGKHVAVAYATGQIDVSAAGKIGLRIEQPKGLSLWVDGQAVDPAAEIALDLSRGVHQVVLKADLNTRGGQALKVAVIDLPGGAGHAQPVGGR